MACYGFVKSGRELLTTNKKREIKEVKKTENYFLTAVWEKCNNTVAKKKQVLQRFSQKSQEKRNQTS